MLYCEFFHITDTSTINKSNPLKPVVNYLLMKLKVYRPAKEIHL